MYLVGTIVDFLGIYIGSFGLWIIWIMLVAVSMIIVLEQSLGELLHPFKEYMEKPLSNPKTTQKSTQTITDEDEEFTYSDTSYQTISHEQPPFEMEASEYSPNSLFYSPYT